MSEGSAAPQGPIDGERHKPRRGARAACGRPGRCGHRHYPELPADVAVQLLSENGWRVSDDRLGGCWTAPDGRVIYGIDEALEVALVGSSRR